MIHREGELRMPVQKEVLTLNDKVKFDNKGGAILGVLEGPVADFEHPTRNGRLYGEKLWDNVIHNPLVMEQFKNGGIVGELDHPADRDDICTEKVAVIMPEPPVKKDGKYYGKFNILDTPCGRIVHTLAKAGFRFGVSSRGTGDVDEYTDEVDPSTYDFTCFDVVLLPAVESARMKLVTEGLETNKVDYKKLLKEDIQKSSPESRKTMIETLDNLGIKLDDIVVARRKLEAIGLMKTYYKMGSINNYVYELYSPLSPSEFFSNPILTTSLLSSIGKQEYDCLVNYYKVPKINLSEFENITVHFSDVYTMGMYSEDLTEKSLREKDKLDLVIDDVLDFDYIQASMPNILNERAFTSSSRKLINRIAYLYNFNNDVMIDILSDSINERGMFSEAEIKKNAKNYYSFVNSTTPKLIYKKKSNIDSGVKNAKDVKEKLIDCFINTSPYDFLKAKYHGGKPTSRDISLIEGLLVDQKLNPGVVNVLIDYVLRINDNKLSKNFVEAIASQWKLNNINDVESAMRQAEKEYRKLNRVKETSKKEVNPLPTWYKKDVKKQTMSEEEVKELESMLSEFK